MAKCNFCNRDMLTDDGCVKVPIIHNGEKYDPIKFGEELHRCIEGEERCLDCNAKVGHYHHPGCDWEECPVCGGQLLSCGCIDED